MRRRFAPVSFALLLVIAVAVSGCGGKSAQEKAQAAARQAQQEGATGPAAVKKSTAQARQELNKALKEAKAKAKSSKSKAAAIASPKQVRAFEKIRKICIAKVKRNASQQTKAGTAGLIASCNIAFQDSVRTAKAQARLVEQAYPNCLRQAKAAPNQAARDKIMIGCNSIPH